MAGGFFSPFDNRGNSSDKMALPT
ncbi:hypothetical protein CCACVL1_26049 [Corchorus capsularis]|uniref:Uncharacterized protein n=1 Tax=Corchorus capsularis TaxID=210143 RepID=A0A1R3GG75_COCAP|nr:hypothetical protein CCACVL1_26049 [Corchorus capsularis]